MKYLALITCLIISNISYACFKTKLEYEVLPTCEVRILSIENEEGVPISGERWAEANENWVNYLQHAATTDFDKNNGVPSTARKIFRSGSANTLYCEIGSSGQISSAYTIPTWWVEAEKMWATGGKEPIALVNGKLPKKELHKSEPTTCH